MNSIDKIKTYGFGVVAQGFHNYLVANEEEERLHTVIIKNPAKPRKEIRAKIEITNKNTIRDREVDTIVELISSSKEAYGIVAENLEIGKKVISANKKLIAENLDDLISKEKENNGSFLYEGAVCGSIPIIRVLNDLFANEKIKEVSGIFNGSSNYILTQLFEEGLSYEEALINAQRLGFAEADPTSDVGGFDALYKLIIVAAHAFGKIVKPQEVLNLGIETIAKSDIEFAKRNNLKIKLIARGKLVEEGLLLSVLPSFVSAESDLYDVENEFNAVLVDAEAIGKQLYKGKGAGSLPTGAVVYSDLKALDQGYRYSYSKLKENSIELVNSELLTVIIGANDYYSIDESGINFESIQPIDPFGKQFIGKITYAELIQQKPNIQKAGISIIAIEDEQLIATLIKHSSREEVLTL
jgi:homoserine dehydrogenase